MEIENASFPDPYDRLTFSHIVQSEPDGLLVSEADGAVVGYVIASAEGGTGLIISIAVSKTRRGRGVGSMLMRAALDYLSGKVKRVDLQVSLKNKEAIDLYRKFSFQERRRIPGYYSNGDDALAMTFEF